MEILNLAWLIPLFPALAFVAIALFTHRSRALSHWVTIGGIALAFLVAQIVFWRAVTLPVGGGEHAFESAIAPWLVSGAERLGVGVWVDPATTVMLLMVPLVCMMIFIYSVGYMNFGTPEVDPRYSRFFCYLSLFATGMLGMVIFNNLLAFFIFWEIMGTCSYLLIGFWYDKSYPDPDRITPKEAGLKAFIVTKIGDLFFMLGLALLYTQVGSLAYRDIFSAETLDQLATTPFLGGSAATWIALLLFGGTVGKSAQFPLHVWLPDAMEGPTPVSALIHAATMVSAGVFLVVRTFPIFQVANPAALAVGGIPFVAAIGAFTAIFSSIMAIAQDDIKGVLAFSTISQLGYMVAALGIGAYVAGVFHLITHAFFKALLFLASGSVIHGVEHGHHIIHAEPHGDHEPHGGAELHIRHEEREGHAHKEEPGWFNPNDMKHMGGLARRMPRTFWTFLIGGLALSGFPIVTAGFWSKDEILAQAFGLSPAIFWTLAVAAGITAFYTMRQICLTFLGEPRTEAAEHAPESAPTMTVPLMILAVFAVGLGWTGIPEQFPVIGGMLPNWFHHFVAATVEGGEAEHAARVAGHLAQTVHAFAWQPLVMSIVVALGGLTLGWLVYGRRPLETGQMDPVEAAMRNVNLGWLYEAMANRFYFDQLYQAVIVKPSIWLANVFDRFDYGKDGGHGVVDGTIMTVGRVGRFLSEISGWFDANIVDQLVNLAGRAGVLLSAGLGAFDLGVVDALVDLAGRVGVVLSTALNAFDLSVVDGAVDGIADLVRGGGKTVRPIQTGKLQDYLLLASFAVLALILTFFVILYLQI